MNDKNFETELVSGDVWIMRRYDAWYPMLKTPQGTLAFLNGPYDHHDGSRESSLAIAHKFIAKNVPDAVASEVEDDMERARRYGKGDQKFILGETK